MRRSVLFVVFFLLICGAGGLGRQHASAQAEMPTATVPPGTCEDGPQPTGAIYRICMPTTWNGSLVVYAHGYVAPTRPVGIPEDQVTLPGGASISDFVTTLGYAFVMSSYRTTGFAIDPAIDDLMDAVDIFVSRQGQPDRVLLTGISDGALISALSAEQYPNVYDGALVLCGTYGDLDQQSQLRWRQPGTLRLFLSRVDPTDRSRNSSCSVGYVGNRDLFDHRQAPDPGSGQCRQSGRTIGRRKNRL